MDSLRVNINDFALAVTRPIVADWAIDIMNQSVNPFLVKRCTVAASRNSLLVRAPDSLSKGFEFESRRERRENFRLQSQICVLTLTRV